MFFWRREEAKHFAFDLEIGNCHEALASLMAFPRNPLSRRGANMPIILEKSIIMDMVVLIVRVQAYNYLLKSISYKFFMAAINWHI
jgi:hypothetical protein